MSLAKVAEKRSLAAILLAASAASAMASAGGCASNHRVSPWGGASSPSLAPYVTRPDLDGRLREIDAETAHLGLRQTLEARGKLPMGGGSVVVRAYEGTDALGRTTHAVRAATPMGIVMAVGPLDGADAWRGAATELLAALVEVEGEDDVRRGAFQAATDLNGDGYPDVVLRSEAGVMEVWRLALMGAARYDLALEVPATRALDADGDGQIDFGGRSPVPQGDPIAPELDDVATFDDRGYSNATPGARAFHASRAAALAPPGARGGPAAAKGGTSKESDPPAPPLTDTERLRRALGRAWHSILAGEPRSEALKRLDAEPVPAPLRSSFDRHRRRIERLGQRNP